MKSYIVKILTFTLVLSGFATLAQSTWYVNDTGSDSNSGTSLAQAFATIQKGVDSASANDSINIDPGTYSENVVIPSTLSNLTVIGTGVLSSDVKIDGGGTGFGKYAININRPVGVTIENLQVQNSNRGINVQQANSTTIKNVIATTSNLGINVQSSTGITLEDNQTINNFMYGICLDASSNNHILNNTATGNSLSGLILWSASNNIVSGNVLSSNSRRGIYLKGSSANTLIEENYIQNNGSGGSYDGILIESSASVTAIRLNNFANNTDKNIQNNSTSKTADARHNYYGTILSASIAPTISSNVTWQPFLLGEYTASSDSCEAGVFSDYNMFNFGVDSSSFSCDTSVVHSGTSSVKLSSLSAGMSNSWGIGGQFDALNPSIDLTGYTTVKYWVQSNQNSAMNVKFELKDGSGGIWTQGTDLISLGDCNGVWSEVAVLIGGNVDLSDITDINLIIHRNGQTTTSATTIYVDDITFTDQPPSIDPCDVGIDQAIYTLSTFGDDSLLFDCNGSTVNTGTKSLELTSSFNGIFSSWGIGGKLDLDANIDLSAYNTVRYWVQSNQAVDMDAKIELIDNTGQAWRQGSLVTLTNCNGVWTEVIAPISTGIDLANIAEINFLIVRNGATSNSETSIFVDDISFSSEATVDMCDIGLSQVQYSPEPFGTDSFTFDCDTTTVHSGTSSLELSSFTTGMSASWGIGGKLPLTSNLDLSANSAVRYWVRSNQNIAMDIKIQLRDSTGAVWTQGTNVATLADSNGTWIEIASPINTTIDLANISEISFLILRNDLTIASLTTLHIDDISFTTELLGDICDIGITQDNYSLSTFGMDSLTFDCNSTTVHSGSKSIELTSASAGISQSWGIGGKADLDNPIDLSAFDTAIYWVRSNQNTAMDVRIELKDSLGAVWVQSANKVTLSACNGVWTQVVTSIGTGPDLTDIAEIRFIIGRNGLTTSSATSIFIDDLVFTNGSVGDICDIGVTQSNYTLSSFGTDVSLFDCNSTTVNTGTHSVELTSVAGGITQSWGIGGKVDLDVDVDLSAFDTASYWVRSNQVSGMEVKLELKDNVGAVWQQTANKASLTDCNGVWTEVVTSIGTGADLANISEIRFIIGRNALTTTSSTSIYVDDITFTSGSGDICDIGVTQANYTLATFGTDSSVFDCDSTTVHAGTKSVELTSVSAGITQSWGIGGKLALDANIDLSGVQDVSYWVRSNQASAMEVKLELKDNVGAIWQQSTNKVTLADCNGIWTQVTTPLSTGIDFTNIAEVRFIIGRNGLTTSSATSIFIDDILLTAPPGSDTCDTGINQADYSLFTFGINSFIFDCNATSFHSGNGSVELTSHPAGISTSWGIGGQLVLDANIDLSAYNTVRYWVMSNQAVGMDVKIELIDNNGDVWTQATNLVSLFQSNGVWTEVVTSLGTGIDLADVANINFLILRNGQTTNSSTTVYIDDIAFSNETLPADTCNVGINQANYSLFTFGLDSLKFDCNSTEFHSGTKSAELTSAPAGITQSWGIGGQFQLDADIDLSAFNTVRYWVKSNQAVAMDIKIELLDNASGIWTQGTNLVSLADSNGVWTEVVAPIGTGADLANISDISFLILRNGLTTSTSTTIYVDDISFTNELTPDVCDIGVTQANYTLFAFGLDTLSFDCDTTDPNSGTESVQLKSAPAGISQSWGIGGQLQLDANIDLSAFNTARYWVKSNQAVDMDVKIELLDNSGGVWTQDSSFVSLTDSNGVWTEVVVPIGPGVDLANISNINFLILRNGLTTTSETSINIDDISFTTGSTADICDIGVTQADYSLFTFGLDSLSFDCDSTVFNTGTKSVELKSAPTGVSQSWGIGGQLQLDASIDLSAFDTVTYWIRSNQAVDMFIKLELLDSTGAISAQSGSFVTLNSSNGVWTQVVAPIGTGADLTDIVDINFILDRNGLTTSTSTIVHVDDISFSNISGNDTCNVGITASSHNLITFGLDSGTFDCNSSIFHRGPKSVELTSAPAGISQSWGIGGQFQLDNNINISSADTARYWVRSNQAAAMDVKIELIDGSSNVWTQGTDVISLTTCNGVWTEVVVPIGGGIDLTDIADISFLILRNTATTTSATTIYVDDVSFIASSGLDTCDVGLDQDPYFLQTFGFDVGGLSCDASTSHSGPQSAAMTSAAGGAGTSWGFGGGFYFDSPADISGNDTIHYWVKSNQNSTIEIAIEVVDTSGGTWTQGLGRLTLTDCNGVWTKVSTTLGFGLDLVNIHHISLLILRNGVSTSSQITVNIDDISFSSEFVAPDPAIKGEWSQDIILTDNIVPAHTILLPTGKVLFFENGFFAPMPAFDMIRIWDPATETLSTPAIPPYDVFCSGQSYLSDGTIFFTGGHDEEDYLGMVDSIIYDPFTDAWIAGPDMNDRRWYPTSITLGNGDVVVISGSIILDQQTQLGIKNTLPQVYEFATDTWRDLTNANDVIPLGSADLLYPRIFQVPDGRIYRVDPDGANSNTWFLDVTGLGQWTQGPDVNFQGTRSYGPAVLYEDANHDINIMVCGGSNPPTNTVEVINMDDPVPAWQSVAPMAFARRHNNTTLLPDGTVLVTGGTEFAGFNDWTGSVGEAEVWDPDTETWTTLAAMQGPRCYHSVSLLLPDGRVMAGGGGRPTPEGQIEQANFEIFSPPYLFNGARPTITSAPSTLNYSQVFTVTTPDAANISLITFIRLGAPTHAFDHNARLLRLDFTIGSGSLSVTAPSTGNVCPPGHYLLFIVNSNGVPSIGEFVLID